jgi:[ribosomal protein S5]-alanine N-acetyltransferase
MSQVQPTLETERLRLRPTIAEISEDHAAVGSDPAVTWQRQAITLDDSRAALANRIRHWELHGFGIFAVLDKADGRLLGHAGLQHLEDTEDIELGYYLARTTQRSLLRLVLAQRWHE